MTLATRTTNYAVVAMINWSLPGNLSPTSSDYTISPPIGVKSTLSAHALSIHKTSAHAAATIHRPEPATVVVFAGGLEAVLRFSLQ